MFPCYFTHLLWRLHFSIEKHRHYNRRATLQNSQNMDSQQTVLLSLVPLRQRNAGFSMNRTKFSCIQATLHASFGYKPDISHSAVKTQYFQRHLFLPLWKTLRYTELQILNSIGRDSYPSLTSSLLGKYVATLDLIT